MKVVYGHTDSIYVQIDSVETAQDKIKEIESHVREAFPNVMGLEEHPVVLEFEKYYSVLGVGTTKNRNAGLITWKDGWNLETPEFIMTGFTAKRVSETKFAKEVQIQTLKMWLNQCTMEEINSYLYYQYQAVIKGEMPVSNFIKRSRLRLNRFTVKCKECKRKYSFKELKSLNVCGQGEGRNGIHKCGNSVSNFVTLQDKRPTIGSGVAGVISAWEKGIDNFDDSYVYLKVLTQEYYTNPLTKEKRKIEYMAGSTYADLDNYLPDWQHYAEQVVKKAEPIYKAMGWDISSIRTGKIQRSLEEWF